jgi:hypothetical protein
LNIRNELRAPELDPDRVERLVTLCDEIVSRVVSGRRPVQLIYAFNRETGRVFGPTTFRGVFGSEECEDFVERILTTLPEPLPEVTDAEAEEMVRRIQDGAVDDRESWYWVRLLAQHYDQPRFSDLIYWPSRELRPAEIVGAARLGDEELDDYLDPAAWGRPTANRPPEGSLAARRTARRLLQEMSRLEMLEVVDGDAAVDTLAPIVARDSSREERASAVADALAEPFMTSELHGTTEQISALLAEVQMEVV